VASLLHHRHRDHLASLLQIRALNPLGRLLGNLVVNRPASRVLCLRDNRLGNHLPHQRLKNLQHRQAYLLRFLRFQLENQV
jgi:hypothetical protein